MEIERLKKQFDLLEVRLDNIDSMVTTVAERMTSRPITLNVVYPKCGGAIKVMLVG